MPLLASLLASIGTSIFGLIAGLVGAKIAARLVAVAGLATLYISCVVYFTSVVGPWMATVFSSQYGQLLGLLFPPISGSIIASLAGYWGCVAGLKYVSSLTKMAVG
jgi:hypothetical protein